jgi:hypothetical protein
MNSLTLLLYGINIVDNIGFVFKWFLGFSIIITVIIGIYCFFTEGKYGDPVFDKNSSKKPVFGMIFVTMFLALSVALFPSERTLYLMAASEIGGRVVTSDKVQGIVDPSVEILQNYIKRENLKIKKEVEALLK